MQTPILPVALKYASAIKERHHADQYISYSAALAEAVVYRQDQSGGKAEDVLHAILFKGPRDDLRPEEMSMRLPVLVPRNNRILKR